jgi:hypothetical protein
MVVSLALDAQQNLWMGMASAHTTTGGLAKFDGENWLVFNEWNSGLPHVTATGLAFDDQGNPWIGTYGGGLAVYHPVPTVDFNGDEIVNFKDLSMLAEYWYRDDSPFVDQRMDYGYLAGFAEYWLEDFRLIAHWKLDEVEGTTAHDSIGTNDGTIHAEPLWQPAGGKISGALQFDGIDDYVIAGSPFGPADSSLSVFAWVKGGTPGQVIMSRADRRVGRTVDLGSAWLGTDSSDGRLITTLMDPLFPPLESESVITDGQWHHIGLVYDLDALCRRLYVDGAEVAKDTDVVAGLLSDGDLYFGAGKDLHSGSFFSGLIDDVRIHNVALSAKEIEELAR